MVNTEIYRGAMRSIAIILLSILLCSCQSSSLPELHLFIWSDYIKPDLIEKFEKQFQCRVIIDTYDSNEAMYAKLKLGATGYDLIFPSNYFFNLLTEQQMLSPIDKNQIPNLKNLDPNYLKKLILSDYGVPYLVSLTGIAYRKDRIPSITPTWNIFAETRYRRRMTMLNDLREAIGAGLKFLGHSVNTQNELEIHEATKLLIEWKRNLAKFESEQYKNGLASAEYLIVQGYSGDVLQIIQENPNIDFIYPEEGSLMSMDLVSIPYDSRNKELAHQFINFLLEGESAAENMAFTLFLSPNLAAYKRLPSHLRQSPILFPPKEVLDKIELIENVKNAYPLYIQAWESIKAAE